MTFKLNCVVLFNGVAVTVIAKVPSGVVGLVAIVKVFVHVGLHGLFEKDAALLAGMPVMLKLIGWAIPESNVSEIILFCDELRFMLISPAALKL